MGFNTPKPRRQNWDLSGVEVSTVMQPLERRPGRAARDMRGVGLGSSGAVDGGLSTMVSVWGPGAACVRSSVRTLPARDEQCAHVGCSTKLSRYNTGDVCSVHEGAAAVVS